MNSIDLISVFVSLLKGISKKEKTKHLLWMYQTTDFTSMGKKEVVFAAEYFFKLKKSDITLLMDKSEAILTECEKKGIKTVSFVSKEYPSILKEIYDPPVILYCRGSVNAMEYNKIGNSAISIVGTRHATGKALRAAFETGFYLSLQGFSIVSGLAIGIDAEAHKGSVLAGGNTVAVLGCGVDAIYPGCNRRIAENIISAGGAIISEYEPKSPPLKYHFPERNRIISGLSVGTVIIEAPEKSGALITADYALEQGRDIFVHDVGAGIGINEFDEDRGCKASRGSCRLAEDGAVVFSTPEDICSYYGISDTESIPWKQEGSCGYFDNLRNVEDDINGFVENYRGVLYRRIGYAEKWN